MSRPRLAPGWARLLLLLVPALLAVAALGAAVAFAPTPVTAAAPASVAPALAAPAKPGLLVHVSGAVQRPGLYRMKRGERIYAAIAAAGGLTAEADPDRMPDLAGLLRDGEQVKVPALKRVAARATRAALVDLNVATEDQLADVPGFTRDLAREAIRYRANFGGFQNTSELVSAVGMDPAAFAIARRYVRV